PAVFKRLQLNVKLNGLANIECLHAAVGEVPGSADFFYIDTGLPSSSSLDHQFMAALAKTSFGTSACLRSVQVPLISLDRFVADRQLARVNLIKVDVESSEPHVLRGMRRTLTRDRP